MEKLILSNLFRTVAQRNKQIKALTKQIQRAEQAKRSLQNWLRSDYTMETHLEGFSPDGEVYSEEYQEREAKAIKFGNTAYKLRNELRQLQMTNSIYA